MQYAEYAIKYAIKYAEFKHTLFSYAQYAKYYAEYEKQYGKKIWNPFSNMQNSDMCIFCKNMHVKICTLYFAADFQAE
jgi:hypothetical protein